MEVKDNDQKALIRFFGNVCDSLYHRRVDRSVRARTSGDEYDQKRYWGAGCVGGRVDRCEKKNVTKGAVASAAASAAGGFFGLPGFEALYAVAGLLVVAYLVMRLRK